MFVSGGENIYPADVERMLERHPDIAQAAVVPIDDDIKGQKPVAFVIKKPGHALDAEAVKRFALANAPAYQHPRFVWFVDELPLASTNKLDRAALHAMAEERIARRCHLSPEGRGRVERSDEGEGVRKRRFSHTSEPFTPTLSPLGRGSSHPQAQRETFSQAAGAFTVLPGHLHRSVQPALVGTVKTD